MLQWCNLKKKNFSEQIEKKNRLQFKIIYQTLELNLIKYEYWSQKTLNVPR